MEIDLLNTSQMFNIDRFINIDHLVASFPRCFNADVWSYLFHSSRGHLPVSVTYKKVYFCNGAIYIDASLFAVDPLNVSFVIRVPETFTSRVLSRFAPPIFGCIYSRISHPLSLILPCIFEHDVVSPVYVRLKRRCFSHPISVGWHVSFSPSFSRHMLRLIYDSRSGNFPDSYPYSFDEIHTQIPQLRVMSRSKRLAFILSVIAVFNRLSIPPKQIFNFFELIYQSFQCVILFSDDCKFRHTPHILVCPPGCGKTSLELRYAFGYLDTDFLLPPGPCNPAVVDAFVSNGFSIITNRWEYRLFRSPVLTVFQEDISSSLAHKGIFPSKEIGHSVPIRGLRVTYDQEKWLEAYSHLGDFLHRQIPFGFHNFSVALTSLLIEFYFTN